DRYLRLCLFEPDDPFDRDRLQRILDEAVDYLRTTFRYVVTEEVAQPKQVQDLFLFASGVGHPKLRRIACLVLKVMHVVHHVEARGLLHRARVSEGELCDLVTHRVDSAIDQLRREGLPIKAAAGSVKTRHSVITKLLAKNNSGLRTLAPELQVGLHLEEHDRRTAAAAGKNEFSGASYKVLNFVADLPVRLPRESVEAGDGRIAFCMVKLQLLDEETAIANEHGENAHSRYKKRQLRTVLRRLSRGLVVPKGSKK